MKAAIPSAIGLIIGVIVAFGLAGGFSELSENNAVSILTSTTGIYTLVAIGFACLFIICLPIDKFRATVLAVSATLFAIAIPVVAILNNPSFFKVSWEVNAQIITENTGKFFINLGVVNIGLKQLVCIAIGTVTGISVSLLLSFTEKALAKSNFYKWINRKVFKKKKAGSN
jgi:hypothetical protein